MHACQTKHASRSSKAVLPLLSRPSFFAEPQILDFGFWILGELLDSGVCMFHVSTCHFWFSATHHSSAECIRARIRECWSAQLRARSPLTTSCSTHNHSGALALPHSYSGGVSTVMPRGRSSRKEGRAEGKRQRQMRTAAHPHTQ